MAIIPIDTTTVAVNSAADLRTALENDNGYTTIYLASHITLGIAGCSVHPNKSEVTLDGFYPLDGTGTIHTLADYSLIASSGSALRVTTQPTSGNLLFTLRNIQLDIKSTNGMPYVSDSSGFSGVTLRYENASVSGPTATVNPRGITQFVDSTVQTRSSGLTLPIELADINRVEIGGQTTLNQTYNLFPLFKVFNDGASITILEGAEASLIASDVVFGVILTSSSLDLIVQPHALLNISTEHSICLNSSHTFNSILIDEGAHFTVIQNSSGNDATLFCNGSFMVNAGAKVYMQGNYSGSNSLVQFSSGTQLVLNNPYSFALYRNSSSACSFSGETVLSITAQQVNYWTTATPLASAGNIYDRSTFYPSWRKADGSDVVITGSTSNSTAVLSDNFTEEERSEMEPVSSMLLSSARMYSVGRLSLAVDPITSDGWPITGTTAPTANMLIEYEGESFSPLIDEDGAFTLTPQEPIPAGTQVRVTSNLPFLISSQTVDSILPGELAIVSLPDELYFGWDKVSDDPILFGRVNPEWGLTVSDSRVRSGPWQLTASISSPLESSDDPSHSLPEALVSVAPDRTIHILSEEPIVVFIGEGNGGVTKLTDVSWESTTGLLMQPSAHPRYINEQYSTPITWDVKEWATEETNPVPSP